MGHARYNQYVKVNNELTSVQEFISRAMPPHDNVSL